MQAFVPKSRRPKFDLHLRLIDLNNVPLVSGTSFIKWHMAASTAAEHNGRTSKCQIRDHKVSYEYSKTIPVRLTVDRNGALQESMIVFEVLQEYAGASARGERISLGTVRLNLAEYVDVEGVSESAQVDGEEGICRRYLMRDSKINSTLKIGIHMKLVEGDGNYKAPSLKSAPVFGGIAGIMAGDQADGDEGGNNNMPSLSKKSKEHNEFQDMYRTNLTAYWTAQPGELRADDCIEDIFAGGDGWGNADSSSTSHAAPARNPGGSNSHWMSERQSRLKPPSAHHSRSDSGGRFGGSTGRASQDLVGGHHATAIGGGVSGRSSLEQHANSLKAGADAQERRDTGEVDEFDFREDLRSWTISAKV